MNRITSAPYNILFDLAYEPTQGMQMQNILGIIPLINQENADQKRVLTLGPKGRNAIIDKSYGKPLITKDGVTVAKEVSLENSLKNMGAQMAKEVASKTADQADDGTTTATVLAEKIYRNVAAGANPIDLKRDLGKALTYL